MKSYLKIVETDRFFNDSPNAGEPNCICSRCQKPIGEEELPLRVAVDQQNFHPTNQGVPNESADVLNGLEFRLCEDCQKRAGFNW